MSSIQKSIWSISPKPVEASKEPTRQRYTIPGDIHQEMAVQAEKPRTRLEPG
jgi:hypothetical protein